MKFPRIKALRNGLARLLRISAVDIEKNSERPGDANKELDPQLKQDAEEELARIREIELKKIEDEERIKLFKDGLMKVVWASGIGGEAFPDGISLRTEGHVIRYFTNLILANEANIKDPLIADLCFQNIKDNFDKDMLKQVIATDTSFLKIAAKSEVLFRKITDELFPIKIKNVDIETLKMVNAFNDKALLKSFFDIEWLRIGNYDGIIVSDKKIDLSVCDCELLAVQVMALEPFIKTKKYTEKKDIKIIISKELMGLIGDDDIKGYVGLKRLINEKIIQDVLWQNITKGKEESSSSDLNLEQVSNLNINKLLWEIDDLYDSFCNPLNNEEESKSFARDLGLKRTAVGIIRGKIREHSKALSCSDSQILDAAIIATCLLNSDELSDPLLRIVAQQSSSQLKQDFSEQKIIGVIIQEFNKVFHPDAKKEEPLYATADDIEGEEIFTKAELRESKKPKKDTKKDTKKDVRITKTSSVKLCAEEIKYVISHLEEKDGKVGGVYALDDSFYMAVDDKTKLLVFGRAEKEKELNDLMHINLEVDPPICYFSYNSAAECFEDKRLLSLDEAHLILQKSRQIIADEKPLPMSLEELHTLSNSSDLGGWSGKKIYTIEKGYESLVSESELYDHYKYNDEYFRIRKQDHQLEVADEKGRLHKIVSLSELNKLAPVTSGFIWTNPKTDISAANINPVVSFQETNSSLNNSAI